MVGKVPDAGLHCPHCLPADTGCCRNVLCLMRYRGSFRTGALCGAREHPAASCYCCSCGTPAGKGAPVWRPPVMGDSTSRCRSAKDKVPRLPQEPRGPQVHLDQESDLCPEIRFDSQRERNLSLCCAVTCRPRRIHGEARCGRGNEGAMNWMFPRLPDSERGHLQISVAGDRRDIVKCCGLPKSGD